MFRTDFAYIPVCLGAWTYIKLPIPIPHCTYGNIYYTVYFIYGGVLHAFFVVLQHARSGKFSAQYFQGPLTASCIELLGGC